MTKNRIGNEAIGTSHKVSKRKMTSGNVGARKWNIFGITCGDIGTSSPSNKLDVAGTINGTTVQATGTCCGSVIAEMVKIEAQNIEPGDAICMDKDGKNRICKEEKRKSIMGIVTNRIEILMRATCDENSAISVSGVGLIDFKNYSLKHPNCKGWYPIAIGGLQEGAKVLCHKDNKKPLQYGDRLVSSNKAGYLKPIAEEEDAGDAVFGKAASTCKLGKETDIIDAWVG